MENRTKTKFCVCTIRPKGPLWCSNIKSKIGVGRPAVGRYHQLKKFFIAGDDPDYRDHDFPTPGYLICPSSYMVIQHLQSGNTQDASGRDHVKFGHTGPLGLERNRQYGRVCLLTLCYIHIQMMDSILICRLIIDKYTSTLYRPYVHDTMYQCLAQANPAAGRFHTGEIVLLTSAKPHPAH